MSVKARVTAGDVLADQRGADGVGQGVHTADDQVVPELSLGATGSGRDTILRGILGDRCELGKRCLAGVDAALAHDGALAVVLGQGGVGDAGRRGRGIGRVGLDDLGGLGLLDLVGDLLRVHLGEDVCGGGGEEGEDGKGAVFLVLFKAPTQAIACQRLIYGPWRTLVLVQGDAHFSLEMRSLVMRSRASDILDMTYWLTT